jgi:formylmethanofuran dehydrogenase subunit A
MTTLRLAQGTVVDPANGWHGVVRDLYVRDGRIVSAPLASSGERIDAEIDLSGRIVMAGGIDPHTHIGGGKVNIARALLPELTHPRSPTACRSRGHDHALGAPMPNAIETGIRYAQMGYTACFEPAMLPLNARQTHLEFADIPIVDKGAYVLLGNDDLLLAMLKAGAPGAAIADYAGWTLEATQAMAIKVVNPGGISAFKFNQRAMDLDEPHAYYGVTPRRVLRAVAQAAHDLGLAHPVHLHGCNLGVPGNVETTLATMHAVDGLPLHLTHLQFHSYGTEGDRKFSSAAARIAEAVNAHPNVSIDIGQVIFGQTVTASGDSMLQYRGSRFAHPHKSVVMDIECDAGCGVVPFRYRDADYVSALQWAIGLELFLLVTDPWRVFLTTDHPNGGPFTSYPHLIRLLMDKSFRNDMLARIHPEAQKATVLGALEREYSLEEIAILTRAGPARSLGLADHGHLGEGAVADIVAYEAHADPERMFAAAAYVFRRGELVVRDGECIAMPAGRTHAVRTEYDRGIEARVADHFDRFRTMRFANFAVTADELAQIDADAGPVPHAARRR